MHLVRDIGWQLELPTTLAARCRLSAGGRRYVALPLQPESLRRTQSGISFSLLDQMIGWSVDLIWSWTSHVRSIYMSRENLSRYLIQFKLPPMRQLYTVANPRRWAGWLRFSNSLRPLRKIYSAWRQRSRRFRVAQEWREANCDGEESIHGHYSKK